jgi:hypothetical protein
MSYSNKTIILALGGILLLLGVLRPDFSSFIPSSNTSVVTFDVSNFVAPAKEYKDESEAVIKALSSNSGRKTDGKVLASLARDIGLLIQLDEENEVIKNTEEIRQANSLVGPMLNLKDKYPDLKEASEKMIIAVIGDESVPLDKDLRNKASQAFFMLAWSYYEGSK